MFDNCKIVFIAFRLLPSTAPSSKACAASSKMPSRHLGADLDVPQKSRGLTYVSRGYTWKGTQSKYRSVVLLVLDSSISVPASSNQFCDFVVLSVVFVWQQTDLTVASVMLLLTPRTKLHNRLDCWFDLTEASTVHSPCTIWICHHRRTSRRRLYRDVGHRDVANCRQDWHQPSATSDVVSQRQVGKEIGSVNVGKMRSVGSGRN